MIDPQTRDFLSFLNVRIEDILRSPRMYGATLEAVELQVLTLLEVCAMLVDFEREKANPRRLLDQYAKLLTRKFGIPNQPLHEIVMQRAPSDPFVALADILRSLLPELKDPI